MPCFTPLVRPFALVLCSLSLLAALALTPVAHALKQDVHRRLSRDACRSAGLPSRLCDRLGTESANVDGNEWDDMAAHAQIPEGGTLCDAANDTVTRVDLLAQDVRLSLEHLTELVRASEKDVTDSFATEAVISLGRILHTVQDSCAHHGVSNPQHGWYSLKDVCNWTNTSPDDRPGAEECAALETEAVMARFANLVAELGIARDNITHIDGVWQIGPGKQQVCHYLRSSATWDGIDRSWDNDIVQPVLYDAFVAGLALDDSELPFFCEGGYDDISTQYPNDWVDTSGGAPMCWGVGLYCIGKGDGSEEVRETPPWEKPGWSPDGASAPAGGAGGCSVGGRLIPGRLIPGRQTRPSALGLFMVAFGVIRRRR